MTDAQRTEYNDYLRARIGNDFGDFGDLIIRKAKGRECEPNKPLPTDK